AVARLDLQDALRHRKRGPPTPRISDGHGNLPQGFGIVELRRGACLPFHRQAAQSFVSLEALAPIANLNLPPFPEKGGAQRFPGFSQEEARRSFAEFPVWLEFF